MGFIQTCSFSLKIQFLTPFFIFFLIITSTHSRFMPQGGPNLKLIDKYTQMERRSLLIGSRPPRCEKKYCRNCGHCEAVQVPIVPKFIRTTQQALGTTTKSIFDSRGNWVWNWRRDLRGGIEAEQMRNLLDMLASINLGMGSDRLRWIHESNNKFSVSCARKLIDTAVHPGSNISFKWVKQVPIKVNIFMWRVTLDRLPTRHNLSRRGMEIASIACPICQMGMETINHILFSCHMVKQVWYKISRWCNAGFFYGESVSDWWGWVSSIAKNKVQELKLSIIGSATCWMLWRFRNSLLFDVGSIRKGDLFDYIVLFSFNWLTHRDHKYKISWVDWLRNPVL